MNRLISSTPLLLQITQPKTEEGKLSGSIAKCHIAKERVSMMA